MNKNMTKKEKYFVYTGNAYPHKNLERLVQAFVLLNKDRKEKVVLKISSSRNIFVERLNKLIQKYNAEDYVKLMGFVKDEEIADLYKNSIAFVFPTLSEGFGLPPMEAINAGTFAVMSDIPVLKEVYQDTVDYFDPFDVHSIKEALLKTLSLSNDVRDKKIKAVKKFLKRYSWNKMARETLAVYESLA